MIKTNLLPAVVIGGPPHSGKSVLAYSLTLALRERGVPHYLLRAYPDGEGDWSYETVPTLVRELRVKGEGSPEWIQRVVRDIANRPLPLLIDPGGKPTTWQEAVFQECTHGILLTPDEPSHVEWAERFQRFELILLADFKSELHGANSIARGEGYLTGTLAHLERGFSASGPAFHELVNWLARLFAYSSVELKTSHLAQAPTELVIELDALGKTLSALDARGEWVPGALPSILKYLPRARAFGVYDRGPNWLYAALALAASPEPFYQFDARLGWVAPPTLVPSPAYATGPIPVRVTENDEHVHLDFHVNKYLDYMETIKLPIPSLDNKRGLVLSGRLPLWMYSGLALAYRSAPWLAVYQPKLQNRAVVVHSRVPHHQSGDLIVL